jgi:8-oxo-dGTP pyrophosphatase MutT (NUDIX family)
MMFGWGSASFPPSQVGCMGRKKTPIPQAAAIAMKGSRICVVTTDGGQDWVIPKGNLDKNYRQTALMEAWEEAGVRGKVGRRAAATFKYRKAGKKYRVKVYVLQTSRVSAQWPEKKSRQRKWLPLETAVGCLKYDSMGKAVRAAVARRAA